MRRLLQNFALVFALALAARSAHSFSLLGPLGNGPGGEAWQTEELGYNLTTGAVDVGAPKNLTEEYRWNSSIITYGFDPSFINYFGTNGIAAIEAAIAVYNSLPDLSTLSQELNEFPLADPNSGAVTTFRDSRRFNFTAATLNLLDMKSYTMGVLAEYLGLASPERWTWTLRARTTTGQLPITNYFTIMRNFDPVTYMPTRYVNGNRYTYSIVELDNPRRNIPIERPADPESSLYAFSTVADILGGFPSGTGIGLGTYFTYLTRDDIGGLRYIYDRDNLNWESFPPGTQITAPDFSSITLISNLDLFSFSSFTSTNPPAVVLAAFPDLLIRTNSSFLTTEVQVVRIDVTNSRPPWGDPFSTNQVFVPILQTNPVFRYTYEFANVLTNYASLNTVVFRTLTGFEKEPWSTPDFPVYRTNITTEISPFPSGAFLIVPTNIGRFNFTDFAFTNVFAVTNVIFATNVLDDGFLRPVQISQVTFFTNVSYGVFPFSVQDAPASVLRGGIGKITFQRLQNAVFTGTNFLHTNSYSISYITNGVVVSNLFTRVQDLPDILFGAADLGVSANIPSPITVNRAPTFVNNGALNSAIPNQGGPGIIHGPLNVIYNKVGPGLLQQRPPPVATEESAYDQGGETFIWGRFDGSTNPPVAFPRDITLEQIELLITGGL
jgi:hypothetical protein